MNVANLLAESARRAPRSVAWSFGDRRATYAEFTERTRELAAGLRALGLEPGDRVLLCLPNRPELAETLLATVWAGLVTVPVNWHLHPREVRYIVEQSGARAVLVADETDAVIDALPATGEGPLILHADGSRGTALGSVTAPAGELRSPATVEPDQPAWLFYTSGTTGRPKGACLSHRNLLAMTLNYYADIDPVAEGSVFAHAAPLTHGSGLYLLPALGRAAANVIFDAPAFDTELFLAFLAREHATHIAFLAPTMLRRLLDSPALGATDLSALRGIAVGGAPLYQADLSKARAALGPIITQIYGQGEAPMTITVMPAGETGSLAEERLGSCGRPFVGVQVRLLDPSGAEVPAGELGEVCVRGDVVMSGYWQNPDATAKAVRGDWLYSGDVGYLDADGYLYLTDRAKDVIITGGTNVYPREVEEVLLTHPGVAEVAVVGVPDDDWGESVKAFVVTETGAAGAAVTGESLIAHVRAHLASFKKPRQVEFVPSLPKNATGKILKRELQQTRART